MAADAAPGLTLTSADRRVRFGAGISVTAVVAALAGILLIQSGVDGATVLRYGLYLVWGIAAPGFLVHRALRGPQSGWGPELALAAATGVLLTLLVWSVAVFSGLQEWSAAWPALTLPLLVIPRARRRILARPRGGGWGVRSSLAIGTACAAVVLHVHRSFFAVTPLPPSGVPIYPDLLWHLGLIAEAERSIPLGTPQAMTAGTLRYHWFANAEIAGESLASGVDAVTLLLRLWPIAIVLMSVVLVATVANDLARRRGVAAVAALLCASTLLFSPWASVADAQDVFRPLSPSQLFAFVPLLLAVHAIASFSVGSATRWGSAAVLGIALLAGAGAKPTVLPILIGGFVAAFIAGLVLRQRPWPYLAAAGAALALFALSLAAVSGGEGGSRVKFLATLTLIGPFRETIDPHWMSTESVIIPGLLSTPGRLAAGLTLITLLSSRALLAVAPVFQRDLRLRPAAWLLTGGAAAGVLASIVVGHPGYSQLYFLYTAIPLGCIAGAWWLIAAVNGRRWAIRLAAAAAAAGALLACLAMWWGASRVSSAEGWSGTSILRTAAWGGVILALVVVVVAVSGSIRRRRAQEGSGPVVIAVLAAFIGAVIASLPYTSAIQPTAEPPSDAVTLAQAEAAEWIEENTPADAVVAVNDHCRGEEAAECDSRVFWASGLGGRRVLVESWSYTSQSHASPFFDPGLLAFNQSLFESPSTSSLARAGEMGVGWLVATEGETSVSPDLAKLTEPVFENAWVTIYRLEGVQPAL